jgi:hypothetical protein
MHVPESVPKSDGGQRGEALNYHPHLHGRLADGYWKDGAFTRFTEVDLKALEQAFAQAGTSLISIRKNSSLTMMWYKFSHRITPDSVSGLATHSTTQKASSSSHATSNELPSLWRNSQSKTTSSPTQLKVSVLRPTGITLVTFIREASRTFK